MLTRMVAKILMSSVRPLIVCGGKRTPFSRTLSSGIPLPAACGAANATSTAAIAATKEPRVVNVSVGALLFSSAKWSIKARSLLAQPSIAKPKDPTASPTTKICAHPRIFAREEPGFFGWRRIFILIIDVSKNEIKKIKFPRDTSSMTMYCNHHQ